MINSSNLAKNIGLITNLMNDKDRKPIPKVIAEFTTLAFQQWCIPRHYFSRYVYKKERQNIFDFLPSHFLGKMKAKFNDREVTVVVENKLYFNFFYGQFGVNLPKILIYNHKKMFIIGDRSLEINNSQDFRLLLISLIPNHDSESSIFIKSTYGTYGGEKVYKITSEQLSKNNDLIKTLYQEVSNGGYLFQETIRQNPVLDKLNPSCINTIRFDTFIDRTGKVEIISAHIRMSINNLHVDNIGSGGCAVAINLETGRLKKYGYMPFNRSGGKLLTEHPLTKTIFENFEIPHFEMAKEMIIKAASFMPGLRLIGWDVGIGVVKPVLIEGNSDYDISGSDLMYGGYGANPVFRKALEEMDS